MDIDFLKQIAIECKINDTDNIEFTVQKIRDLDERFEKDTLIDIYNYLMSVVTEPKILTVLIQCSDIFRSQSSLNSLLDLLLMKNITSVSDEYTDVRVLATKAIANLKNTAAVTPLLYCLNNKDENYKIRLACADALGKIGDRYAVVSLIDVVKDEDEKSVYLRESAASALGMLGDLRAVEPLVGILEAQKGIWSKFTFLKERVIEALGKLTFNDDERVFNALKNSLIDDSPQVRINAIEAIMDSENPKSVDVIKTCLLEDDDDEVKKNAMIALYNLVGREILDEVISGEKFSDSLKMEAVAMISEYENEEGIDD